MLISDFIEYDFANEYSKYPGGRFVKLGPHSGEDFRERILKPLLKDNPNKGIRIDASGVETSFSPSFLDECFGQLAKDMGINNFNIRIHLVSNVNPKLKDKMMYYVKRAI